MLPLCRAAEGHIAGGEAAAKGRAEVEGEASSRSHHWCATGFRTICRHTSCLRPPSFQLALLLTSVSPVVPYYPGGSLFERNPPMPKVCMSLTKLFKAWATATFHGVLQVDLCVQMQQHLDFGREGYH